eukprot:400602-Lingulodinium_polyedra.AAC.1
MRCVENGAAIGGRRQSNGRILSTLGSTRLYGEVAQRAAAGPTAADTSNERHIVLLSLSSTAQAWP